MKKLAALFVALMGITMSVSAQEINVKKLQKDIVGKWCNPYTYQSTGELKGFQFKKNGKCEAVNIPSLQLKTWEIDSKGYLIIKGEQISEDGKKEPYETRERISQLNDTLELISREKSPRLVFIYLQPKKLKQLIVPETAE